MRRALPVAGLLLLAACAHAPRPPAPVSGRPLALTAERLPGRPEAVAAGPAVVLLWASWSADARIALGDLAAAARHGAPAAFVPVSVDADRRLAREAAEVAGLDAPILVDPGGRQAALLGLRVLPTVLVVDARGEVTTVLEGWSTRTRRAALAALEDAGRATAAGEVPAS